MFFTLYVAVSADRQVMVLERDAALDATLDDGVLLAEDVPLDADRLTDVRHCRLFLHVATDSLSS